MTKNCYFCHPMNENKKQRFVYNVLAGLIFSVIAAIIYAITHFNEIINYLKSIL